MKKIIFIFAMTALIMMPAMLVALPAGAQVNPDDPFGKDYASDILPGDEDTTPQQIAASVIRILMTFLGIVAVVIILLGGFKWMTAAGNEDKVDEAKKLIRAGIIGLIIIMAAWVIANWVITSMGDILEG